MTLQHAAGRVAREYRRLSDVKGGTSLDDQGVDNLAAADDNDWTLHGEPYVDDGLSASRYARKARDDFEKLVADLRSGPTGRESRFGADVLMLWESSRGSRKVGEWVSFIELCEAKQVRIWVTTHERLYDPCNGRDRKSLLEDAVDSEYESYKTHRRVARTAGIQARKGRPYGFAPDGMRPVYNEKTGKLLTWVENPDRSHIAKELFRLLEAGVTLTEIARRFGDKGYRNLSGSPFRRSQLRDMATRHSYAGLRSHRGEVYEGIWDGIVPVDRFWNVQRILGAPHRKTTRNGRARHELTGALWCAICGSLPRVAMNNSRKPVYRCGNECWMIQKDPVDDYIIGTRAEPGALMSYLARKDLYQLLAAPGSDEAAVRDVQVRLAQARAELEEMEQATAKTLAEVQVLGRSIEEKRADVKQLEDHEQELTLPPAILNMIRPGRNVWDSWEAAPISARREVVRVVLSPRGLGRLSIRPALRTGPNQPVIERLVWQHVTGASPAPTDGE